MKGLSFKVSLGGILSALSVVLMFMTGLLPPFVYVIPAICGAMLLIIAIEVSSKWAYITYAAVSVLCMLLVPDKEASLLYVFLMGFYPTLRQSLNRINPKLIRIIIKLIIYNVLIVLYYNITIRIVSDSSLQEDMTDFGRYGVYIFWAVTNIVFIIYDVAIGRLMYLYIDWLRAKILRLSVKKGDKGNER